MLDPISSNQAIGTATRPWITTPTARLSRIWAPTLDYSSMWGNWNFNLGPNDWDFLSISLLLTLTKTGQHSLPPHIWPQELRQGLLNSADGVLSLIPILPQIDKDAWLPNPNEIFPNLQEEPSIHPQNEVNALYTPILEECVAYAIATPFSVEPPCRHSTSASNGFWHYTRFSGSLSSLDITNGNRSHNKPLELI